MKLTDAQNAEFVNDPRRLAAEKELNEAVASIRASLKHDGGANYYMMVLPPKLKRLEEAYEQFAIVEATVESQILGRERYHG